MSVLLQSWFVFAGVGREVQVGDSMYPCSTDGNMVSWDTVQVYISDIGREDMQQVAL